jgi:hypothetical protein
MSARPRPYHATIHRITSSDCAVAAHARRLAERAHSRTRKRDEAPSVRHATDGPASRHNCKWWPHARHHGNLRTLIKRVLAAFDTRWNV